MCQGFFLLSIHDLSAGHTPTPFRESKKEGEKELWQEISSMDQKTMTMTEMILTHAAMWHGITCSQWLVSYLICEE